LHAGRERTLSDIDVERRKLLLTVPLHLNKEPVEPGFGGVEAEVQIGSAAIPGHNWPRDLGMNVQRGCAVVAETDNVSEGAHDWLELRKTAAVGLRDMDGPFGWLIGFKRAIKGESVLQAVDGCG
jgi:hypothetical protein